MGTKVVILEDDASNARLFLAILLHAGYEPVSAASCWEVQQQVEPDTQLLIADLFIHTHPCCRGTDVALRTVERYPHVKVLFVSGTPVELWGEADLQKMASLPRACVDFLCKPFTPKVLLAKVDEILGRTAETPRVSCPYRALAVEKRVEYE